jgi:hypothetical protein
MKTIVISIRKYTFEKAYLFAFYRLLFCALRSAAFTFFGSTLRKADNACSGVRG